MDLFSFSLFAYVGSAVSELSSRSEVAMGRGCEVRRWAVKQPPFVVAHGLHGLVDAHAHGDKAFAASLPVPAVVSGQVGLTVIEVEASGLGDLRVREGRRHLSVEVAPSLVCVCVENR